MRKEAAATKLKAKSGLINTFIIVVPNSGSASQPNVFSNLKVHIMPILSKRHMKFYYTYILQSAKNPNRFYTGFTEDLESRLKSHNQGNNPHTAKDKPWRIKTAIAFTDHQRAFDFESYLKSPSGRAFAKKRL